MFVPYKGDLKDFYDSIGNEEKVLQEKITKALASRGWLHYKKFQRLRMQDSEGLIVYYSYPTIMSRTRVKDKCWMWDTDWRLCIE